ncbi:stabilizer of axonemal microtubules 1-like [Patiria miniata]|uniref:Uncharacterized protein n=1 Tax=Patiria miniata TaxID=46514 RepID=A0A913Z8F2_PATMI|nr:stabilizer of axonemal microtubules 1-like [Patiria miniata]
MVIEQTITSHQVSMALDYSADRLDTASSEARQIMGQQFPNFTCICEICDCGRHKHHKNCKRKNRGIRGSGAKCALSHYQQTFKHPDASYQRRLPIIPPPTPRDLDPPHMDFNTIQRSDYQQRVQAKKQQPIKMEEKMERSNAPIEDKTMYRESFPGHSSFPAIKMRRPATQNRKGLRSAKFDSRTSNKEHYKHWVPRPAAAFGELPSFTGSILYPGQRIGELESVTRNDFPGNHAEATIAAKKLPDNIVTEGEFDHGTTNRHAYQDMGPQEKTQTIKFASQLTRDKRAKFDGKTQNMRDFPGYRSQPLPQRAVTPPPATIRLSMDSRIEFVTEQQDQYPGHDTRQHPKPELMLKDPKTYSVPTTKFTTTTTNKMTYKPIDTKDAYSTTRMRPMTNTDRQPGKFDDQTINKRFYKDWGVKPRIRYGDLHEANIYIPPVGHMAAHSETMANFDGKSLAEPTRPFLPATQPAEDQGKQDFRTVHKETYKGLRKPLCKAEAYMLQQELIRRKTMSKSNDPKQTVTAAN